MTNKKHSDDVAEHKLHQHDVQRCRMLPRGVRPFGPRQRQIAHGHAQNNGQQVKEAKIACRHDAELQCNVAHDCCYAEGAVHQGQERYQGLDHQGRKTESLERAVWGGCGCGGIG